MLLLAHSSAAGDLVDDAMIDIGSPRAVSYNLLLEILASTPQRLRAGHVTRLIYVPRVSCPQYDWSVKI